MLNFIFQRYNMEPTVMQAAFLVKQGDADQAFSFREVPVPVPAADEILIRVSHSGLNFADVMARRGMYKEAPPLPCVLGYDVAGVVVATGSAVTTFRPGDAVVAMTRFGGYAQYAVTRAAAAALLPPGLPAADAPALATQYCTAYYMAAILVNLFPGDRVLIHSGAGGVGQALIRYARHRGCEVFSTAGSPEKLEQLRSMGVQHPVNYRLEDFESVIREKTGGKGVDVIFDAVGGRSVKKGFRALAAGGRLLCYGASVMSNQALPGKIASALGFGFYHPVMLMMPSKSLIGVNMLRIADEKPELLQHCLQAVMQLTAEGVFTPAPARVFPAADIAAAHTHLENRSSMGKLVLAW